MSTNVITVRELIEHAARTVNATPTFVASVVELFRSKGISLESRAEPYADMIATAFTSHGAKREAFARIQEDLTALNSTLLQLQRAWLQLAEKTRLSEEPRRRQADVQLAAKRQQKQEREDAEPYSMFMLRPALMPN